MGTMLQCLRTRLVIGSHCYSPIVIANIRMWDRAGFEFPSYRNLLASTFARLATAMIDVTYLAGYQFVYHGLVGNSELIGLSLHSGPTYT